MDPLLNHNIGHIIIVGMYTVVPLLIIMFWLGHSIGRAVARSQAESEEREIQVGFNSLRKDI